jgi:hypothetical protein
MLSLVQNANPVSQLKSTTQIRLELDGKEDDVSPAGKLTELQVYQIFKLLRFAMCAFCSPDYVTLTPVAIAVFVLLWL